MTAVKLPVLVAKRSSDGAIPGNFIWFAHLGNQGMSRRIGPWLNVDPLAWFARVGLRSAYPRGVLTPRQKRRVLAWYSKTFAAQALIETGTYLGDTVEYMRQRVRQVVSIELDPELCGRAAKRFTHAGNVRILCGNSAGILRGLPDESNATLYWLDAHYSGEGTACGPTSTPLWDELETVLARLGTGSVILIDDIRHLGQGDYPTLQSILGMISRLRPDYDVVVADDILRITPKPTERSA